MHLSFEMYYSPRIALALSTAESIAADGVGVAPSILVQTLIHIFAASVTDAIAFKPILAPTFSRSHRVLARRVVVTISSIFQAAFIDILASLGTKPVAGESRPTDAEMTAFGVTADGVLVASARQDAAFVDVGASIESDPAAFVARNAFALTRTDRIGTIGFMQITTAVVHLAFVYVVASVQSYASSFVAGVASASARSFHVGAGGFTVTTSVTYFALVNVHTAGGADAVTVKSRVTGAFSRPRRVSAVSVIVAASVVGHALVDILAALNVRG